MRVNFYTRYGKRIFDFLFSLVGLLLVSPLLILIGLAIRLSDGGRAIFVQKRMGSGMQPFNFYKFRTMIENADQKGPLVTGSSDNRITPVGRILRKYKLDELPQLLNVLKGEISLVGPRPEVEKYVNHFEKEYREVLVIKPGITDYAALAYRNEEEILKQYDDPHQAYVEKILPAKIELYKKYMNDISLSTDLKLIARTIGSMFN